eukprot:UN06018
MLNLDCDHYINNSKAVREAMCFLMDPNLGPQVCYVQFPQRFDGIDRNEQFWVIGGISAHLFAVFQGLLKVLAGIDTNFTVTSKANDEEGDFAELYMFKWTTLLIPPTTILIINMVGDR